MLSVVIDCTVEARVMLPSQPIRIVCAIRTLTRRHLLTMAAGSYVTRRLDLGHAYVGDILWHDDDFVFTTPP